ncbi:hypothetical protein EDF60_1592 [Leucobacter luti]|uniref:hypothetical protein n=1 Tax=Leucobacter luti TaxID=340320 RepID=UPI00104ED88E|nr:hypothetical protein [Leucobacter luti]MCW2286946.1 hypothetical protein [Leucobacter luti]TCK41173.1 hypothetical protein EDF60_1592 [Leucobacter luti]
MKTVKWAVLNVLCGAFGASAPTALLVATELPVLLKRGVLMPSLALLLICYALAGILLGMPAVFATRGLIARHAALFALGLGLLVWAGAVAALGEPAFLGLSALMPIPALILTYAALIPLFPHHSADSLASPGS